MDDIQIVVKFSADSVAGDGELTQSQVDDYAQSLYDELKRSYPGAEVEVTEDIGDSVRVRRDGYTDDDEAAFVETIIAEHWQEWIESVGA